MTWGGPSHRATSPSPSSVFGSRSPKGYLAKTYQEACAEYGMTMAFVERIHEAVGLPVPAAHDRVREDDLQMFPIGRFRLGIGLPEAGIIRAWRVYAENLDRIAQAETQFFHTYVEEPMLSAGATDAQMLDVASEVSPELRV
jgi:hypothetical protein